MEKEKTATRIANWFNGLKVEFNKIIWPDRKTMTKQTIAVVAVAFVLGIIIAVLDFVFQYGVDFLVNLTL